MPAAWWFYTGDIPADRLSVFKHVEPSPPYYDLRPGLEKQFGTDVKFVVPPDLEEDLLAGRAGPPEYIAAHKDEAPVGGGA